MPAVEISFVNTDHEFLALRDAWRDLFANSDATIFQSWEWAWNWWRSFGSGKRLALATASEGNRLCAIVPLYVSRGYGPLPIRVAALLGTASIDHGGWLVRRDASPEGLRSLMDALAGLAGVDCFDFQQMDAGVPLTSFIKESADEYRLTALAQESCYQLPLVGISENLEHLSKKFRDNLNYSARRLMRDHTMELDIVERVEELPQAMKDFFYLHNLRWRSRKLPGSFVTARRREFHIRLATDLLSQGLLLLSFLRVDGERVACVYGYRDATRAYYYQGGFDPEWGRHSVSSLLLRELVLWAIRGGYGSFEFLRGGESYKLRWGASERPQQRLLVGGNAALGGLACSVLALENKVVLKAKSLAQRA